MVHGNVTNAHYSTLCLCACACACVCTRARAIRLMGASLGLVKCGAS